MIEGSVGLRSQQGEEERRHDQRAKEEDMTFVGKREDKGVK